MSRVNWVDALAIIIILRSTYIGAIRGLLGELFYILGIFLAIIFGLHFYIPIANFMNVNLFIPLNIAYLLSFLLASFLTHLFIVMLYNSIRNMKIVKIEASHGISRVGGTLMGFIKGFAVVSIMFLLMLLIPIQYITDSAKERSFLGPYFIKSGVFMYEKTLSMFSGIEARDLKELLAGAKPINLGKLKIKRKDRIDEILQ